MAAKGDVQVQGLCRWSYPSAPGAFQKEPENADLADLRDHLYAPERLNMRLFFLEYVMLPALRAQTDKDFTLHLLMGDQLPDIYKQKVLALIADVPQIRPVFASEGQPHQTICRQIMLDGRDPSGRVVAEFRLDDDDAVAVDFVEMVRDSFFRVKGIWRHGGKLALDFNKGYILTISRKGLDILPVIARYWTPGLVLYLRPGQAKSLLDFNHVQLWKRIPTITMPRMPMFIRGAHGQNDSSVSLRPSNAELEEEAWGDAVSMMQTRFGIDVSLLADGWENRTHWGATTGLVAG